MSRQSLEIRTALANGQPMGARGLRPRPSPGGWVRFAAGGLPREVAPEGNPTRRKWNKESIALAVVTGIVAAVTGLAIAGSALGFGSGWDTLTCLMSTFLVVGGGMVLLAHTYGSRGDALRVLAFHPESGRVRFQLLAGRERYEVERPLDQCLIARTRGVYRHKGEPFQNGDGEAIVVHVGAEAGSPRFVLAMFWRSRSVDQYLSLLPGQMLARLVDLRRDDDTTGPWSADMPEAFDVPALVEAGLLCGKCGYSLAGLHVPDPVCPECGWKWSTR